MKKGVWIAIIVVVVIVVVGIVVLSNNKGDSNTQSANQDNKPVKCSDPPCLGRYFPTCTPAELTMASGDKNLVITIYGFENETCHYTMVMDGITAADCYFKKEQLTDKVLNQMFGNKEGQDAIIAGACK